jgi:hypothetical protein
LRDIAATLLSKVFQGDVAAYADPNQCQAAIRERFGMVDYAPQVVSFATMVPARQSIRLSTASAHIPEQHIVATLLKHAPHPQCVSTAA